MECHKCPHNQMQAGAAYELSACATCDFTDRRNYAEVPYSDEVAARDCAGGAPPRRRPFEPAEAEEVELALPLSVLASALRLLLRLPDSLLLLVIDRYRGLSTFEIAARRGLSRRTVQYRTDAALREYPLLKHLFPKVPRRGPRARGKNGQGDGAWE